MTYKSLQGLIRPSPPIDPLVLPPTLPGIHAFSMNAMPAVAKKEGQEDQGRVDSSGLVYLRCRLQTNELSKPAIHQEEPIARSPVFCYDPMFVINTII